MPTQRPITIDDVARVAGYSVATVSRALRGLPNVAPSTRRQIEDVAARLNYRPDPAAIRLATGRSRTVAMAVPSLATWYFGQVMAGAEALLTDARYDLLVFSLDSDPTRRLQAFQGPTVARAAGVIVVDLALSGQEAATLYRTDQQVVAIGTTSDAFSSVRIDDIGVAESAVGHLVELGHRRIGLLKGQNDDPFHFDVPRERQTGYRNALLRAGIPVDPDLERSGNFSVEGGAEAMAALLDLEKPPTAVFAMSDEMAFGAMQTLWSRGLSVPDDVSLVGVDNHELSPVLGLTTIDQSAGEHGVRAAELLLTLLDTDHAAPVHHQMPIRLIERRSSASAP